VNKISSRSEVDSKNHIMAFKVKDNKSKKSIEDAKSKKSDKIEKIENKSKESVEVSPTK